MPKIKVNTDRIKSSENDIQSINRKVNLILREFDSIYRNLDWDIKAASSINSRLSNISRNLSSENRSLQKMQVFLVNAKKRYDDVERLNSNLLIRGVNSENLLNLDAVIPSLLINNFKHSGGGGGHSFANSAEDENFNIDDSKSTVKIKEKSKKLDEKYTKEWGKPSSDKKDDNNDIKFDIKHNLWEKKVSKDIITTGDISGSYGLASGNAYYKVGDVYAKGSVDASIWKDGMLAPSLTAAFEAGGSIVEVGANGQIGDESNNFHGSVTGKAGTARAYASGGFGVIYDDDGNAEVGVEGKVGAEAYAVKGEASGGFTFLGIKVDVVAEGGLGGASAVAEGKVTTGGVHGKIGLGWGVGGSVSFNVDFSDSSIYKGIKDGEKYLDNIFSG